MQKNRGVVAGLFKEVEEFHEAQSKVIEEEKVELLSKGGLRHQAVQNNMLLDSGHAAHQLSLAKVWSTFTVPDPIGLRKITEGTFMLTSHDSENACQLMQIDAVRGFTNRVILPTENNKVFAACLLNSGIAGETMSLEDGVPAQTTQTLILGCSRGILLKFEKGSGESQWRKTGENRLEQNVTDLL